MAFCALGVTWFAGSLAGMPWSAAVAAAARGGGDRGEPAAPPGDPVRVLVPDGAERHQVGAAAVEAEQDRRVAASHTAVNDVGNGEARWGARRLSRLR